MTFARYGLAAALMLAVGAFALPGKAQAGGGVAVSVPGFSLYVGDRHRHYRHRYYKRRYYRGRHHYRHRHYGHRHHHHRRHYRHWR